MLLKQYRKEFCRPPNPEARHLRCVAYLDEDISEVLPYLNTLLNGHQYIKNPPSLTFKFNGKLITLYAKEIGINIVKDEEEAHSLLKWLEKEINDTGKDAKRSYRVLRWQKNRVSSIFSNYCLKPTVKNAASLRVWCFPHW
jgi:ArsR family metal-binding transcriptional regulator